MKVTLSILLLSYVLQSFGLSLAMSKESQSLHNYSATNTSNASLTAPGAPTFEQTVEMGIGFLEEFGVNPNNRLRCIQVLPLGPTGSRRPAEFTRMAISLEATEDGTIFTTINFRTSRRLWSEPTRLRRDSGYLEKFLHYYDWDVVVIKFAEAFDRVLAAGHIGPWVQVRIVAHEAVRGGREPFYEFRSMYAQDDPLWLGVITGDFLYDPLVSPRLMSGISEFELNSTTAERGQVAEY